MELFVLKVGAAYIRVRDGEHLPGGLQQASVFPTEQFAEARSHLEALRAAGLPHAHLCRLCVTEEPCAEEPARDPAAQLLAE